MITHIFSDLDGTLLNEESKVSAETIQTIQESNIPISLVSARTPNDMNPIVKSLQTDAPHVSFNGALIYKNIQNKRVILSEKPLKWHTAKQLVTAVQLYFPHIGFSFYDENNWYTCRIDEGIKLEESIGFQTPQVVVSDVFFNGQPRKIFKIMLWVFDSKEFPIIQHFFESLGIDDISIVQSGAHTLEITHKEATKSFGIDFIMSLHHLTKDDVATFGDGHNDIPMLKKVGTPIVMDNATDEIKAYAKYITKSNIDHGVSYGIKKYLIN